MQPRRRDKINKLLHRLVGELLKKEFDIDALVTVLGVATSSNGQEATVRISVYPYEKSARALKEIEKNIYRFQQLINRGLDMRPVPKIKFKIDTSQEKGDRILRAMDQL